MSDLETFNELVDDIWEMVFGNIRRPEVKFKGMMTDKKPKRARTKGRYKADDKSTKEINEAWVGGKHQRRGRKMSKVKELLGFRTKKEKVETPIENCFAES